MIDRDENLRRLLFRIENITINVRTKNKCKSRKSRGQRALSLLGLSTTDAVGAETVLRHENKKN